MAVTNVLRGRKAKQVKEQYPNLEEEIERLFHSGYTGRELAAHFSVDYNTFYYWLKKLDLRRSSSEANALAWEKGRFDREAARASAYARGLNKSRVGRPCPWKGQTLPAEWRNNISRAQEGLLAGEKHPRWKGGPVRYGTGWALARRLARERANGRCQHCNRTVEEIGRPLDIHHKVPVREFPNKRDAHTPENLEALCRRCHVAAEPPRL